MATIELTVAELGILCSAAGREGQEWQERRLHGDTCGWYDSKEKDRVLTRQHQTGELVVKLQAKLRGVIDA